METIKIKYFNHQIDKIKKFSVGNWIDLRSAINLMEVAYYGSSDKKVTKEIKKMYNSDLLVMNNFYELA